MHCFSFDSLDFAVDLESLYKRSNWSYEKQKVILLWALVFSRASRSSPAPLLGIVPFHLIGVSNKLYSGIEHLIKTDTREREMENKK